MTAGRDSRLPGSALALAVAAVVLLALVNDDEIRDRAGAALEAGMPAREAALARGFVLGQDDRVDARTVEDFRRAGLSHLLAVSGQNVALLALLAMPLLALLGLPLRARLVWVLGLIAVYVVLAGAGPSIQRAGVMGALSVLATLAGRRASRLYALLLAAIVTLAIEPRIGADVGWQLSFAAVTGILLLAAPLRRAFAASIGGRPGGAVLAEGAAVTISATLATAPLIAHRFGELSTTTLIANLLVLPAVAPAMWLGMLAAMAGQVPGIPTEAINSLNALLLSYIAQVAAWCGRPSWACLRVQLDGAGLALSYLALAGACLLAGKVWVHLRSALLVLACAAPIALAVAWPASGGGGAVGPPSSGLRVSVLDVGQGNAVLLQAADEPAVLVDGGPPGGELATKLRAAGVDRLGAAIVSHDQSDHAGGIGELLGEVPIAALFCAVAGRPTLDAASAAGVVPRRLAAGRELRWGRLRLRVLWPPPELLGASSRREDPNRLSLVLLLRWRDFSMLLPGDAEAEATPLDPGPVDVLAVAHHGSEDAGLDDLLERTGPRLAVVSVGAGNPFGHPTAATMGTLAEHRVPTLRTDRAGTVVLDVRRGSFRLGSGG